MSGKAHITILREKHFVDRLRDYRVWIDGVAVAVVRSGQSVNLPVSPGRHALALTSDWCNSDEIPIEARAGEHMIFRCGSHVRGWGLFSVIFFKFWISDIKSGIVPGEDDRGSLWLRRVTEGVSRGMEGWTKEAKAKETGVREGRLLNRSRAFCRPFRTS